VLGQLGNTWNDVWDKAGHTIDRLINGGSDLEKLSSLRLQKSIEQGKIGGGSKALIADFDRQIEGLRLKFVADMDRQRQAALSRQSTELQALKDRYNPTPGKLAELKADRDRLVAAKVDVKDPAIKAIDEQIRALSAGYRTASQMSADLARQSRETAKDARDAAREAAEAEAKRLALQDHRLDNERALAVLRDDKSALDYLDRQARLQEQINRYVREGLALEQARSLARAQMADEMQVESDTLRRERSNPADFVSSADRMKAALGGATSCPFGPRKPLSKTCASRPAMPFMMG